MKIWTRVIAAAQLIMVAITFGGCEPHKESKTQSAQPDKSTEEDRTATEGAGDVVTDADGANDKKKTADGDDSGADDLILPGTNKNLPFRQCYTTDAFADNPYPTLKVNSRFKSVSRTVKKGYVAVMMGPTPDPCLTDETINKALGNLNADLKELVELLNFPGYSGWKKGEFLNWHILMSGLPGDKTETEKAYATNINGVYDLSTTKHCACVESDWYRNVSFHEATHVIQFGLNKFNNPASGWWHEAHNTYLGSLRSKLRGQALTIGYLVPASLLAEHIPVESTGFYSDDTIADPSAASSGSNGNGKKMLDYFGGIN